MEVLSIITFWLALSLQNKIVHCGKVQNVAGDDTCSNTLGMENGEIKPEQIIASSSHEPSSVGPNNARLNVDISGGAWCPRALIDSNSKEYIEIDLEKPYLISGVLTQGRFGNGQGQEFAEAFRLQYWRNGMKDFVTYKSRDGQEIMKGNSNTYTVKENILESPVVAQKVRIVPFASHSRTVCMRLELLGCPYETGVVSYTATAPYRSEKGRIDLLDDSFDGFLEEGKIKDGLGQLIDGVRGSKESPLNPGRVLGGLTWVGWKNESNDPIDVILQFESERSFRAIYLDTLSSTKDSAVGFPTKIELLCYRTSSGTRTRYLFTDFPYDNQDRIEIKLEDANCRGNQLHLKMLFKGKWLALSEISFDFSFPEEDFKQDMTTEQDLENPGERLFIDLGGPKQSDQPMSQSSYDWDGNSKYLGAAIGVLVTVVVLLLIVVLVIATKERRNSMIWKGNTDSTASSRSFFPTSTYGRSPLETKAFKAFRLKEEADTLTTVLEPPIYSEPFFESNSFQYSNHWSQDLIETPVDMEIMDSSSALYACPQQFQSSNFPLTSSIKDMNVRPEELFFTYNQERSHPTTSPNNKIIHTLQLPMATNENLIPCYASTDLTRVQ